MVRIRVKIVRFRDRVVVRVNVSGLSFEMADRNHYLSDHFRPNSLNTPKSGWKGWPRSKVQISWTFSPLSSTLECEFINFSVYICLTGGIYRLMVTYLVASTKLLYVEPG